MRVEIYEFIKERAIYKMEHKGVVVLYDKKYYHNDKSIELSKNGYSKAVLIGKTAKKFEMLQEAEETKK